MKHDVDFLKDAATVIADAAAEQQAQELRAKRSAAAKKGWATRRENELDPSYGYCECTASRARFMAGGNP